MQHVDASREALSGHHVLFVISSFCSLRWARHVFEMCFYLFPPYRPSSVRGGGGGAKLPFLFSFLCSANHGRDWPLLLCKKSSYVGLATNTLNLRNNNIERYSIQKRRPSATYILYYTGKLVIADGSVEFCETTPIGLVDEPKISLYGRETDRDLRSACRCVA